MSDSGQRTEKPTKRKLEKARREGQFPASRQLLAALQFLAFVALFGAFGDRLLAGTRELTRYFLSGAFDWQLTPRSVAGLYQQTLQHLFQPLLEMGVCLTMVALTGQLASTRLGISLEKLAPDPKRLNPIPKLSSIPRQNAASLAEALVFLPVLAFAVWKIASENWGRYAGLTHQALMPALALVTGSLKDFLWKAAFLFLAIGCLDFLRIRQRHNQSLRMTKQEVRDELKETEGNPQLKARVRRIQRDMARRNMMKEIPQATAVIVNPTHYSVAIRYEMESMAAPMVLAKGKNYLARRIRQIANEHQIPVVENQPLAQALYKSAEVGQEIPAHLYRAVAEVLAYIFRLMRKT